MDQKPFSAATRSLTRLPSRRHVLRGLAAAGLALGAAPRPADARKKRRRRVRLNAFGCVDVGGLCKTAGQCCSGICEGKKGKKKCRAHDTGGCQAGARDNACGGTTIPCTTSAGEEGFCDTTTGDGGFCAYSGSCFPCSKDAECQPFCGPQAACIRCDGCPDTGGTSCAHPHTGGCDFV